MKWLELFLNPSIEIWILILSLIWIIAIALRKIKMINEAKSAIPSFAIKIRALLKKNNFNAALEFCMEDKSAISNIVRRGLKKHKFGKARFEEELDASGQSEVVKLEENMGALAAVSAASPLVGFLGTVLSIGSLFRMLENPQNNATFGDFSDAIWNALVSSGLGIFVGIVAVIVYNYLVNKISKAVIDMERIASEIFDLIEIPENESGPDEFEKENAKE